MTESSKKPIESLIKNIEKLLKRFVEQKGIIDAYIKKEREWKKHKLDQANKIIDLNFHLGIGGVVTFKNGKISEFLNAVPIDKIVLETDSPYLAPAPYRGKRNESFYIELVAKKIAEVYDVDLDYVSEVTDKNALDIFGS